MFNESEFNECQLFLIRNALAEGLDIANPALSEDQMLQVYLGLQQGVDVSKYAFADFERERMSYVRKALVNGYDISLLCNERFKGKQLWRIYIGLLRGVEMASWLTYEMDADIMFLLIVSLSSGIKIPNYLKDDCKGVANSVLQRCFD